MSKNINQVIGDIIKRKHYDGKVYRPQWVVETKQVKQAMIEWFLGLEEMKDLPERVPYLKLPNGDTAVLQMDNNAVVINMKLKQIKARLERERNG